MGAHAMFPVQHGMVGESLSGRAEVHIMFRIVGKRISYELARTALRVVFSRLPAILPGAVKIDLATRSSLHGCVIGIVAIGYDLFW